MRTRGFTLLELSMVVATIGVLAAILLPGLARARESARRNACMSNLMNLSMALHMYAQEHDQQLPWSGGKGNADGLLALRGDYVGDLRVFVCPSDSNSGEYKQYLEPDPKSQDPPRRITADLDGVFSMRTSYDYVGAYTRAPITLPANTMGIPRVGILWDLLKLNGMDLKKGVNVDGFNHIPGGCNVLFLDGSIEFIKATDRFKSGMPVQPQGIAYDPQEPPQGEQDERNIPPRTRNGVRHPPRR